MIAYASRTGTRRNLDALRAYGWRLVVSAMGPLRTEGFQYGLDNGAWTAFQQGIPFHEAAFQYALDTLGAGADWTVVPDIVGGGRASLDLSLAWLDQVKRRTPVALLAVQEGITPEDVWRYVGPKVGIFVGGRPDTTWKLDTLPEWCELGRATGAWVHVGRVNSAKRINACSAAGATSFDGTSVTRYAKTIRLLDLARRQRGFHPTRPHA